MKFKDKEYNMVEPTDEQKAHRDDCWGCAFWHAMICQLDPDLVTKEEFDQCSGWDNVNKIWAEVDGTTKEMVQEEALPVSK